MSDAQDAMNKPLRGGDAASTVVSIARSYVGRACVLNAM